MGDVEPSGRSHPLTCPSCRAPVPLGEGDRAPCPYCAAEVDLPEWRAPTSGWFRATVVIPQATPGQWYSLCLEIQP